MAALTAHVSRNSVCWSCLPSASTVRPSPDTGENGQNVNEARTEGGRGGGGRCYQPVEHTLPQREAPWLSLKQSLTANRRVETARAGGGGGAALHVETI